MAIPRPVPAAVRALLLLVQCLVSRAKRDPFARRSASRRLAERVRFVWSRCRTRWCRWRRPVTLAPEKASPSLSMLAPPRSTPRHSSADRSGGVGTSMVCDRQAVPSRQRRSACPRRRPRRSAHEGPHTMGTRMRPATVRMRIGSAASYHRMRSSPWGRKVDAIRAHRTSHALPLDRNAICAERPTSARIRPWTRGCGLTLSAVRSGQCQARDEPAGSASGFHRPQERFGIGNAPARLGCPPPRTFDTQRREGCGGDSSVG